MTERVLCEIEIDEWTGMEYPKPYNGNCFYTSNSEELRQWKSEVLKEHSELKGRLRIMPISSMEKQQNKVLQVRKQDPAYREYEAYIKNGRNFW